MKKSVINRTHIEVRISASYDHFYRKKLNEYDLNKMRFCEKQQCFILFHQILTFLSSRQLSLLKLISLLSFKTFQNMKGKEIEKYGPKTPNFSQWSPNIYLLQHENITKLSGTSDQPSCNCRKKDLCPLSRGICHDQKGHCQQQRCGEISHWSHKKDFEEALSKTQGGY